MRLVRTGKMMPFRIYGATCDSVDVLSRPFYLPETVLLALSKNGELLCNRPVRIEAVVMPQGDTSGLDPLEAAAVEQSASRRLKLLFVVSLVLLSVGVAKFVSGVPGRF